MARYDNSPLQPAVRPETVARYRRYLLIGGIFLIIIVGAVIASRLVDTAPEVTDSRLTQEALIGDQTAPVKIVEYGAYGCSTCRAVRRSGVVEQVLLTYGDQVSLVFRSGHTILSNDPMASEAAQCALDQGDAAFWTYHNTLFELPVSEYRQLDDHQAFADLATQAGIDGVALKSCLDARTHQRTVKHWEEVADDANIVGTPTFFVNGQPIANPNALEGAVRSELGMESN